MIISILAFLFLWNTIELNIEKIEINYLSNVVLNYWLILKC